MCLGILSVLYVDLTLKRKNGKNTSSMKQIKMHLKTLNGLCTGTVV